MKTIPDAIFVAAGKATGAAAPPTSVRNTVKGLAPVDAEGEQENASSVNDDDIADAETALEAMSSFRLAEGALQRNDVASAEAHARKALAGDPSNPDYIALLAWLRTQGSAPQSVDEAIRTMSKILIEDPSNEKALLYRGKLLMRTNRLPEALHDISELLAANPGHREAQELARKLNAKLPGQ